MPLAKKKKCDLKIVMAKLRLACVTKTASQIMVFNINSVFLCHVTDQHQNSPRGYRTFFVLNSVEHEILNTHKYKNIKKFGLFKAQLSLECYFSRSYMLKCQQLLAF